MASLRALLSNSFIVSIGSLVGGAFAYLFNVSMGRLLGPVSYGDLGVVLAVLAFVMAASGAILMVVTKFTSEAQAKDRYASIRKIQRRTLLAVFGFGLALAVVGSLVSPLFSRLLTISSPYVVVVGLFSVLFTLVATVNKGVLQGLQRFLPLSIVNAAEHAGRFLFGFLLVKFGFDIFGAVTGLVLAGIATLLISAWLLRDLKNKAAADESGIEISRAEVVSYTVPTAVLIAVAAIIMNLDIFLVKLYFPPEPAGLYVAVSTTAKIIFYLTGPIAYVMFPMITRLQATGERHYLTLFGSIGLTLAVSVAVLLTFYLKPTPIIGLLYGETYTSYAFLLPAASLLAVLFSFINLFAYYYLSIKRLWVTWLFVAYLVVQSLWARFNHESISVIIGQLVVGMAVLLLVMVGYYLFLKRLRLGEVIMRRNRSVDQG